MAGWSPWVPHLAHMTSDCEGPVGIPVEGPPRMTLTITQGIFGDAGIADHFLLQGKTGTGG